MLQFAHRNGCAWDLDTCWAAATGGQLAVLQYAHQYGCAWSSFTCQAAARGGHLAVLQFANQNGCEWGPEVCSAAAECGNLSMLKWLRQHGCPWDWRTSHSAATHNHLAILRWARQQQPPCPWWLPVNCDLGGCTISPRVLVFLRQHGAHLTAGRHAQAHVAATEMTYAFLSLRAALPDKTPHDIVQIIMSLAFS